MHLEKNNVRGAHAYVCELATNLVNLFFQYSDCSHCSSNLLLGLTVKTYWGPLTRSTLQITVEEQVCKTNSLFPYSKSLP